MTGREDPPASLSPRIPVSCRQELCGTCRVTRRQDAVSLLRVFSRPFQSMLQNLVRQAVADR
ncbi:2Fe-2S iron-sulfur cluster-binding protein [Citrobacter amalonaticus]|uniref:2Fe-2S iron-sulfur cluster-binding protein n=1 Tax=Citrobacter amalonaticus TaxID=35703 RepID=UPI003AABF6A6